MSLHYVEINKKQLTAVSLAMSKDESRYYLKGVCFQISDSCADNQVLVTATDGHVLAHICFTNTTLHNPDGVTFIAPEGFIKAALKAMKAKGGYAICFNDQTQELELFGANACIPITEQTKAWNAKERKHVVIHEANYKAYDCTYPDYWRLIMKSDVLPEDNELTYAYCKERKRIVRILDLLGDDRETLSFRSTGLKNNAVYRSPVKNNVSHTLLLSPLPKPWVGEISEKDSRVCVDLNTGKQYTEN